MRYIVTVAALIISYGLTANYAQQAYIYSLATLMWKISNGSPWSCTWERQWI